MSKAIAAGTQLYVGKRGDLRKSNLDLGGPSLEWGIIGFWVSSHFLTDKSINSNTYLIGLHRRLNKIRFVKSLLWTSRIITCSFHLIINIVFDVVFIRYVSIVPYVCLDLF